MTETDELPVDERPPAAGCSCDALPHGRGDCPTGCGCGWCAPELHDRLAEISPDDIERFRIAFDALSKLLVDAFTPIVNAAVDALAQWWAAIEPLTGHMPGKAFRKARKAQQIRDHRARVAARVPAWKRKPGAE